MLIVHADVEFAAERPGIQIAADTEKSADFRYKNQELVNLNSNINKLNAKKTNIKKQLKELKEQLNKAKFAKLDLEMDKLSSELITEK